jgi:hypothetical protein
VTSYSHVVTGGFRRVPSICLSFLFVSFIISFIITFFALLFFSFFVSLCFFHSLAYFFLSFFLSILIRSIFPSLFLWILISLFIDVCISLNFFPCFVVVIATAALYFHRKIRKTNVSEWKETVCERLTLHFKCWPIV